MHRCTPRPCSNLPTAWACRPELGKAAQDGLLAMKHCETLAKALPHDEQREFLAELPTMTGRTRHDLLAIIKGDLMHRTREAKRRGAMP